MIPLPTADELLRWGRTHGYFPKRTRFGWWKMRCSNVAQALSLMTMKKLVNIYRGYSGPIAETSMFANRRGAPFVRHSWCVDRSTEDVYDPTQWIFTDSEPTIAYVGAHRAEEWYDEGMFRFRESICRPVPFPTGEVKEMHWLSTDCERFVAALLRVPEANRLTRSHRMWLANCPPRLLGNLLHEIVNRLTFIGDEALIPIDVQTLAFEKIQV